MFSANDVKTLVGALILAGVGIADAFYFAKFGLGADELMLAVAVGALGLHVAFGAGVASASAPIDAPAPVSGDKGTPPK